MLLCKCDLLTVTRPLQLSYIFVTFLSDMPNHLEGHLAHGFTCRPQSTTSCTREGLALLIDHKCYLEGGRKFLSPKRLGANWKLVVGKSSPTNEASVYNFEGASCTYILIREPETRARAEPNLLSFSSRAGYSRALLLLLPSQPEQS